MTDGITPETRASLHDLSRDHASSVANLCDEHGHQIDDAAIGYVVADMQLLAETAYRRGLAAAQEGKE